MHASPGNGYHGKIAALKPGTAFQVNSVVGSGPALDPFFMYLLNHDLLACANQFLVAFKADLVLPLLKDGQSLGFGLFVNFFRKRGRPGMRPV
jgi:hypothetical protein